MWKNRFLKSNLQGHAVEVAVDHAPHPHQAWRVRLDDLPWVNWSEGGWIKRSWRKWDAERKKEWVRERERERERASMCVCACMCVCVCVCVRERERERRVSPEWSPSAAWPASAGAWQRTHPNDPGSSSPWAWGRRCLEMRQLISQISWRQKMIANFCFYRLP